MVAWGLRREMTKGKARIPMARPRVVVPEMGDKIGFIKFKLFVPFAEPVLPNTI